MQVPEHFDSMVLVGVSEDDKPLEVVYSIAAFEPEGSRHSLPHIKLTIKPKGGRGNGKEIYLDLHSAVILGKALVVGGEMDL